jgi:phosphoglucosamine mutase
MKRMFGTDGIRAVAGEPPLDPATVRRFGAALGELLTEAGQDAPRVLLGRDTRESGPWLRDAVADGLVSRNARAVDAGVITTPGLAYSLRCGAFDAGVMISASHNAFQDNGLKAFASSGVKLSDALEQQVESKILDGALEDPGDQGADVDQDGEFVGRYSEALRAAVTRSGGFSGTRVVLDCANGSAAEIAPRTFRDIGAEVVALGTQPNGTNINLGCGSLHLDRLAARVKQLGFDVGFAYDGDADRCLAVDRRGRTVDGDHILFIAGRAMKGRGELRGSGVVATIMSNFWLERGLEQEGIHLHRAPVGDKYVLERMLAEDLVLGGEQSGHIIFRNHATTGDGILTSLLLLQFLLDGETSLESIMDGIEPCPQVLINVRVREKPDLRTHAKIGPVVDDVERGLQGSGRVVLRYSGTEPVTRVMVEGQDADQVRDEAQRLADAIAEAIGDER